MKQMKKLSPFIILDYIRSTVEILMDHKSTTERNEKDVSNTLNSLNYEKLLQQMEGESREHIAVSYTNI